MNAVHPTMRQALAPCLPPGFQKAPVMHAISVAESAHISRLEAQVAAQAAVIAALRTEAVRKEARIDILSAALRQYTPPPCPPDHIAHTFQHPDLGEIECHLYAEAGSPRTEYDPGDADLIELRAAYPRCADIAGYLTQDDVERIEIAAAAQIELNGRP